MAKAKRGLGKGLGALIPQDSAGGNENRGPGPAREIPVENIIPNKNQPRKHFDQGELEGLAETINSVGIIEPLILRKHGEKLEIVAGERRWRAAKLAGLETVPAVIREIDDAGIRELALIENIQREDLNPLEEARAFQELLDELELKQEELAKRVGKSRTAITNSIRLLNLPQNAQGYIVDGKLSAGHARALLSVRSKNQINHLAEKAVRNKLSVRELETLAGKFSPKKKSSTSSKKKDGNKPAELQNMEKRLEETLGSPVSIVHKKSGGKIEITYFDNDDLERILDSLE